MAKATPEDSDRQVIISFTETTVKSYQTDFDAMAKVLGLSRSKLKAILDDGKDWEVSDKAKEELSELGELTTDPDWTLDEIGEGW